MQVLCHNRSDDFPITRNSISFYKAQVEREGISKCKGLAHLQQEKRLAPGMTNLLQTGLKSDLLPHGTVESTVSVQFHHRPASTDPSI